MKGMRRISSVLNKYKWIAQYLSLCGLVFVVAAANFEDKKTSFPDKKPLSTHPIHARVTPTAEDNAEASLISEPMFLATIKDKEESTPNVEKFENWMLCRSDETEIFFNVDALNEANGGVAIHYTKPEDERRRAIYTSQNIQEFVKSPDRFVLKLTNPSHPKQNQVNISTHKLDSETIYTGQIQISSSSPDSHHKHIGEINCTPLTRAARTQAKPNPQAHL